LAYIKPVNTVKFTTRIKNAESLSISIKRASFQKGINALIKTSELKKRLYMAQILLIVIIPKCISELHKY